MAINSFSSLVHEYDWFTWGDQIKDPYTVQENSVTNTWEISLSQYRVPIFTRACTVRAYTCSEKTYGVFIMRLSNIYCTLTPYCTRI